MDCQRTGEAEYRARHLLVFQLRWRPYAIGLRRTSADPGIMLGQFMGLFIYSRNIYLIWMHKKTEAGQASLKAG